MIKKISFVTILFTTLLQLSCATGPSIGITGTATANVATGAVDVGVDQSFTVSFSAAVKTETVTTSSFFVVPVIEAEASIIKFVTFDSAICDVDQAVDAAVTCETSTECTLSPSEELIAETDYAICLSSAIQFLDSDTYGYFEGLMESFTTETPNEESEPGTDPESGGETYSIGGSVSGLTGTVILQNNAADDLTLTANGSFAFDTELDDDDSYAVTVKTQPAGQTCTVTSGNGTINSANVTTVNVACANQDSGCDANGLTNTPYANSGEPGIDGSTEEKAYTICTAAQLDQIGQHCTDGMDTDCDKYFKLMADIDLADYEDSFHMIGYLERVGNDVANTVPFTGTFDGNDHTLSNLNMTLEQEGVGFIRFAQNSTVKDLTIENFEMAGRYGTGILFAIAGPTGDIVSSPDYDSETDANTVLNVTIDDQSKVYFYDTDSMYYFIGALAGAFLGDITNVHVQADINAPDDNPGSLGLFCGGLVGSVFSDSTISNASSTNATMGACVIAGGLLGNAGYNIGGAITVQNVTISNVYSNNDVPGSFGQGGLIGMLYGEEEDDIIVTDCYATGDVSATNLAIEPYFIGGLLGGSQYTKINRCYASGNVTSTEDYIGGLIGSIDPVDEPITVLNSFSTGDVEGDGQNINIGPVIGRNDGTDTFTNTGCYDGATVTNHGEGSFNTDFCALANQHSMAYYYDKTSTLYVDGGWDFDTVWQENEGALPTLR
jgi:hypothetical protein